MSTEALGHAARAFVDAIERGETARSVFTHLVDLLARAARVEGVPSRTPPSAVPPITWRLAGGDPLRAIYREDSSVEVSVRELHALVAPYVLTGEMRELAWELAHAWGDVATSLVRPLWELAYA